MLTLRKVCLSACLSFVAIGAQAKVVQIVVDVIAQSRQLSSFDQQTGFWSYSTDPTFAPQQFEFTAQFDLDNPSVDNPRLANSNGTSVLWGSVMYTGGAGASTLPTPFTAGLLSGFPPAETAVWPLFTQAIQNQMTPTSESGVLQPVSASADFNTIAMWQTFGELQNTWTYGRSISFKLPTTPLSNAEFRAWSDDEFVASLQASVGVMNMNTFSEMAYQGVAQTWMPDFSGNKVEILGDVVLRSVSVVPEPSTSLLLGLGLVTLVAARRTGFVAQGARV